MRIVRVATEGLRNLEPLTLEPHPRFNILEGKNGQGKTNLLEVLYLMATLRSFRENRVRSLLHWHREQGWVRAAVERDGVERNLAVELSAEGRRASIDGARVQRLGDYFGHFHVVFFGPDDLGLTKGGPAGRRRFLDRAIFNVDPVFLDEAREYLVAMRHRNDLLRGGHQGDVLDSYDETVARRGARILWRRHRFLKEFGPAFQEIFAQITNRQHEAELSYQGLMNLSEDVDEQELHHRLAERLSEHRPRDLRRGQTGVGPHLDDILLSLDGHLAREHASQGQHRMFALALKIGELQRARASLGSDPVLLLDDVSSELDEERNQLLMSFLDQSGGQVFITTTDRSWIQLEGQQRIYRVNAGAVTGA